MKIKLTMLLALGLAGICAAGTLGTTFTYQGILSEGGAPVGGTVDLRFALWDAETTGSQVGAAVEVGDLFVSDGRVSVPLDFGDVFDGNELWLAVEVRDGASGGAYTTLTPRQALTAAPYAAHAIEASAAATAGHADTADWATNANSSISAVDADLLDGQHGSYYQAWGNLLGIPSGLDDGDDDTLGALGCDPGEIASWTGSAWNCAADGGETFSRTIVVGPVGDSLANGAALLAAVDSVGLPASAAEGWLVMVEPGEYDLGGDRVTLEDWVHLQGSGQSATMITSEYCGSGGVVSRWQGELSDLTVENTCSDPTATAGGITTPGAARGARINRVAVELHGAVDDQWGVWNGSDDSWIQDLVVDVSGGVRAYGVYNYARNLYLIDVIASASGSNVGYGAFFEDNGDGVMSRGSYSGTGSIYARGLFTYDGSIDASDVHFEGDEYGVRMFGVDSGQSGNFSRVTVHGGFYVESSGNFAQEVRIEHSRIDGDTNTIFLVPSSSSVRVSGTELSGGPVSGPVVCVAVWDEGTGFYPSTCP